MKNLGVGTLIVGAGVGLGINLLLGGFLVLVGIGFLLAAQAFPAAPPLPPGTFKEIDPAEVRRQTRNALWLAIGITVALLGGMVAYLFWQSSHRNYWPY